MVTMNELRDAIHAAGPGARVYFVSDGRFTAVTRTELRDGAPVLSTERRLRRTRQTGEEIAEATSSAEASAPVSYVDDMFGPVTASSVRVERSVDRPREVAVWVE